MRFFLVTLIWTFFLARVVCIRSASAAEIDPQTMEMLQVIIDGFRGSRAGITDLTMQGSIDTICSDQPEGARNHADFRYYHLGEKRRTIEKYDPNYTKEQMRAGETFHLAFDGEKTLEWHPNMGYVGVYRPSRYRAAASDRYLNTIRLSGNYSDYVGHIEFLLRREWFPEKQQIRVEPIQEGDNAYWKVSYESTRGFKYTFEYVFDVARGFEPVRVRSTRHYADDRVRSDTSIEFRIEEVAEGIYYPVAYDLLLWVSEEGLPEPYTIQEKFQADSVEVNTGMVPEGMFRLESFQIEPGTRVVDTRIDPPLVFAYDMLPIAEGWAFELARLSDSVTGAEEYAAGNSRGSALPPEPSKAQEIKSASTFAWFHFFVWGLPIFLLSIGIGYLLARKRRFGSASETPLTGSN